MGEMMDDDNTITPTEYVRDAYPDRDDIIVWYNDLIIDSIFIDNGNYYVIYRYDDSNGYSTSPSKQLDKYAHCLRVEPSNPEYMREQMRAIVELIPDSDIASWLEDIRCSVEWQGI
jgi:hypothetical protein